DQVEIPGQDPDDSLLAAVNHDSPADYVRSVLKLEPPDFAAEHNAVPATLLVVATKRASHRRVDAQKLKELRYHPRRQNRDRPLCTDEPSRAPGIRRNGVEQPAALPG